MIIVVFVIKELDFLVACAYFCHLDCLHVASDHCAYECHGSFAAYILAGPVVGGLEDGESGILKIFFIELKAW